jgi:hypothetical protein
MYQVTVDNLSWIPYLLLCDTYCSFRDKNSRGESGENIIKNFRVNIYLRFVYFTMKVSRIKKFSAIYYSNYIYSVMYATYFGHILNIFRPYYT